jgi:hypothetical protein
MSPGKKGRYLLESAKTVAVEPQENPHFAADEGDMR